MVYKNTKGSNYISKLFMPPDSADRFLTAPVRAVRSFRRHSHSVFCQEPVRRPLGSHGPHGPPGLPGSPRPLGSLKPPGPLGPPEPLGQLGQSGQLKQLKQL